MTLQEKRTTMLSKVDEWQTSGMSLAKFAKKNNIPSSTFSYWISKSKRLTKNNKSVTESSDFIRFSGNEFLPCITGQEIKLQYPNGVSLIIPVLTKDKPGSTHRGYHWIYYDPIRKIVIFDYQKTRGTLSQYLSAGTE
jgi:hypothetical protein